MLSPHASLPTEVALIGAGRLGTALGRRLQERGFTVQAIIGGSEAPHALAEALGAPVASTRLLDLPATVRLVFLCVPDAAIGEVAADLAVLPHAWPATLIAHTSGALTAGALAPVAQRGARALSFHPVQTFTADTPPSAFEGIYVGMEGEAASLAWGRALAAKLGARVVVVQADVKPLYHLAASVASNFFVTLQALATELLSEAGIDRPTAAALLRPLVEGTWRNLQQGLPEDALTGPVARGDAPTVAKQTTALQEYAPHLLPVISSLMTETIRVGVRGGHLNPDQARTLLHLVEKALQSSS